MKAFSKSWMAPAVLALCLALAGLVRAGDVTPMVQRDAGRGAIGAAALADNVLVPGTLEVTGASTFTGGIADGGAVTTIDINGGTIDGVTIGAAAAPTVTNLGSVATCDINGGSIDGATIGAAAAGAITGTTITGTTITDGTVSRTGGTVTGTWADLGSVTTIDINGGSIDGATIGAAAAGAITGTTITGTTLTDGTISTTAGAVTGALNISGATVTYRAIAAADLASALQDAVPYAAITGVDNTDGTGSVTIQVRDAAGNALAGRFLLRVWVSTAAYGAPAAITGFAVTTGTQAQEVVANADRWVITDANGVVVMSLSDAATHHVMAHGAGGVLGYISQAVTGP